jgi:ComF family protein
MPLINDFLSLIYPRHCEACGNILFKHETFICNFCKLNLPKTDYHKINSNELIDLFAGRIPLKYAIANYQFEKKGCVQKLIHAIKYQNQKELAEFIGKNYANDLEKTELKNEIDIILPVPLHKNKLKARGYNQSEWFAKGISNALLIPMDIVSLQRISDTATQTKKKKYQRWENVEGIFKLTTDEYLLNKHVLLVDDVITTGSTIEAAWQALKLVSGITISVASIAFAGKKIG